MVRASSPAKLRPWSELTAKMVLGVVPGLVSFSLGKQSTIHIELLFRNAPVKSSCTDLSLVWFAGATPESGPSGRLLLLKPCWGSDLLPFMLESIRHRPRAPHPQIRSPSPPQGSIWHRSRAKSGKSMSNRCQIDPWGWEGKANSRVGSGGSVPTVGTKIIADPEKCFQEWN